MTDNNDAMEERLERALDAVPVVTVPEGFALRVAGKVPAGVQARVRGVAVATRVGSRVAWGMVGLLLVAIFVLAPSSGGTGMRHWLEFSLELEFVALTVWLSVRPLLRSR